MRTRGRSLAHSRTSAGAALLAVAALVLGVALGVGTGVAGAVVGAPVTDYANYPSPLPDGCPDGPAAVVGARFDNGRGGEEADLRRLPLRPGDTLRVSWDDFAEGCTGPSGAPLIAVSLHAYDLATPTFVMNVDQQLLDGWVACGAGLGACTRGADGRYELSIPVPGPAQSSQCNTQMGFVIGLPLAVVGPSGSYYNALLRNDDRPSMGIGATNFAIPNCVPGVAGTATGPTAPPPVAPTSTAVASVSPTSTALPPAEVLSAQLSAAPTTSAPVAVAGVQVNRLPQTGSPSGNLTLAGLALLLAGTALVLGSRRRAGERWGW